MPSPRSGPRLARSTPTGRSAGAFRGFGVPQAAIATEALLDDLAEQLGLDRLEIRLRNALRHGSTTATGQTLAASAGLVAVSRGVATGWDDAVADVAATWNAARDLVPAGDGGAAIRRGVGIGAMWYGIGNTSLPNPSTIRVGLVRDGSFVIYSGAFDIGQGSNTVVAQIVAETLEAPLDRIRMVTGDTDRTPDAGKTSASRQTFVSGNAARLAALDLLQRIELAGPDLALLPEDRRWLRTGRQRHL